MSEHYPYWDFEIQAGEVFEGTHPWLLVVHKPCGINVLPLELGTWPLEVALADASNHLKTCQKRSPE